MQSLRTAQQPHACCALPHHRPTGPRPHRAGRPQALRSCCQISVSKPAGPATRPPRTTTRQHECHCSTTPAQRESFEHPDSAAATTDAACFQPIGRPAGRTLPHVAATPLRPSETETGFRTMCSPIRALLSTLRLAARRRRSRFHAAAPHSLLTALRHPLHARRPRGRHGVGSATPLRPAFRRTTRSCQFRLLRPPSPGGQCPRRPTAPRRRRSRSGGAAWPRPTARAVGGSG